MTRLHRLAQGPFRDLGVLLIDPVFRTIPLYILFIDVKHSKFIFKCNLSI
jgi:hypothetical protein